MTLAHIRSLLIAGTVGVVFVAQVSASAAVEMGGYPSRPTRFIEALGVSSTTDVLARLTGEKLTQRLGQHYVVDNRPGAGGNIGAEIAARSAPDGYTLFMGIVPVLAAAKSLYGRLSHDVAPDLDSITTIASGNYVLVVGPAVPVTSTRELIVLAKLVPGQKRYGSAGVGSTLHLAMEMFKSSTGVDILHIPYKGGRPMVTALIGGEVDIGTPSLALGLPFIRAGKLRPLALTSARRSRALPQLPTIAEAVAPGYDLTPWYATFAPAGTPRAIVNLLNAEFNQMLRLPDIQAALSAHGLEASGSTTQGLREIMLFEVKKWAKVIKDANIKAE